jgi:hypothetical protein
MKANDTSREVRGLLVTAIMTVVALLGFLICSLAALGYYSLQPSQIPSPFEQVVIAGIAGISGSSFRALWSACERIAHGWELRDGTKLPDSVPPDKFSNRLICGLLCRPFLGAFVGVLIFLGVKSGVLLLAVEGDVRLNTLALGFVSAVAGLFAKRFAESLSVHLPA